MGSICMGTYKDMGIRKRRGADMRMDNRDALPV